MKIDGINLNTILPNILNKNFKIGDILVGQITEITNETYLLLAEKEETIMVHHSNPNKCEVGDIKRFLIKNIENDKIFVDPEYINNKVSEKETTINLPKNDLDQPLYKIMIENEVPLTEKNIKLIEDTKKYYGKLSSLTKEIEYYGKGFFEKEISSLVKELMLKSSKFEFSGTIENLDKYIAKITNLCKNISLDELVFMMKNDLEFNLKNLENLQNIFLGKESVTDNIIEIVSDLSQERLISKEAITSLLNKFKLENTELKTSEALNSFIKEIENIILNIRTLDTSSKIGDRINHISSAIDFLSKLNENFTFVQIPIYLNRQVHNFELMIRREDKKKNINIKNTKLLISIDTSKLNLVRALIDIKNNNLVVLFKIQSEMVKEMIYKNEENLIHSLKRLGYTVSIKYNITEDKQDNINNFKLLRSTKYNNSIDMRV